MTTKKAFIKRAMACRPSAKEWRWYIDKAIASGCLKSFDDMEDNYRDVYPLVGAILEEKAAWFINGSPYEKTRRACRREANNIRCFI